MEWKLVVGMLVCIICYMTLSSRNNMLRCRIELYKNNRFNNFGKILIINHKVSKIENNSQKRKIRITVHKAQCKN